MKILVLGESDTGGGKSGGVSWPGVLRERIEATGESVEIEHTTFIPTGSRERTLIRTARLGNSPSGFG